MKKALILTSILAISTTPAFATPTTESTFSGTMLENRSYTGAATETNTGITSGTVTAEAYYTWDLHNIAAGTYWPQSTVWDESAASNPAVAQCPANSFCAGVTGAHYETFDQGKTACSTVGDGSYTSSAAGASAETECYKTCTTAVANIAHATSVAGNDYYGAGTDTCYATACENGYHTETNGGGSSGGGSAVNLSTAIGDKKADSSGFVKNDANGTGANSYQTLGLVSGANSSDKGKFVVDYGDTGRLSGIAVCSTRTGSGTSPFDSNNAYITEGNIVETLTVEDGQTGAINCYCKLQTYTPSGGETQEFATPYMFYSQHQTEAQCVSFCPARCIANFSSNMLPKYSSFRHAMFGSVTASGALVDLASAIGNNAGIYAAYIGSGGFEEYSYDYTNDSWDDSAQGQSHYGISGNHSFAVEFSSGILTGQARCSTQTGNNNNGTFSNPTTMDTLTEGSDPNGNGYCYCKLDTWKPNNGNSQELSGQWVVLQYMADGQSCSMCEYFCASDITVADIDDGLGLNYLAFRSALFNNTTAVAGNSGGGSGLAICVANTINITWRGADAADVTANNAGTALYAGDINTPVKAKHQAGKSFSGWRFLLNDANGQPTSTPVQMSTPASADPINNGAMPYVAPAGNGGGN